MAPDGGSLPSKTTENVIRWCSGQYIKARHALLVEDLKNIPELNRGTLLAVSTVGLLRHRWNWYGGASAKGKKCCWPGSSVVRAGDS